MDSWPTAEAIAFHEAGHAVLAHRLGETTRVSIEPEGESQGRCSSRELEGMEFAYVYLAGLVATRLYLGTEAPISYAELLEDAEHLSELGFISDRERLMAALEQISDEPSRERWWREVCRTTEARLRENWRKVELVAAALLERKTLDAGDLKTLLGRSERADFGEFMLWLEAEYGEPYEEDVW